MKPSLSLAVLLVACRSAPAPAPTRAPAPIANQAAPPQPSTPQPATTSVLEEANEMFATRCAMCHGATGGGDGPAAGSLDPRPHDYRLAAWQASVTDAELAKIIIEGGQAVGKSALMPGSPYLADRPELVTALVSVIRGFAKPATP